MKKILLFFMIAFVFISLNSAESQEIWIHHRIDTAHVVTRFPASLVDSISIMPCDSSSSNCCQFALRLLNQVPGTFKTIRITPANPSAITNVFMDDDFDGDEWSLTASGTAHYDFNYVTGFIPASSDFIDAEFTIQVDHSVANPVINVEWIDGNGVTQKTEQITLACVTDPKLGDDDFTYNWASNTKPVKGDYPDERLFAGAEAEPCQPPSQYKSLETVCGTISHTFVCSNSTPTVLLNITPPTSGDIDFSQPITYNWNVNGTTGSGTGISYPITGSGSVSINVSCDVYAYVLVDNFDGDGNYIGTSTEYQNVCTQNDFLTYCVPSAEFVDNNPQPICDDITHHLTGWNVKFEPSNSCDIGNFKWDFGDGTPNLNGSGNLTETTHTYATAGTYTVSLSVEDVNGCKLYTFSKTINISTECTPQYHANYEWCDDSLFKDKHYPVVVTFTNQSTHFCNTKFIWNFGDGSPAVNSTANDLTVQHTYNALPNSTFTVTLTMSDSDNCPTPVTVSHPIILKPIKNNMQVIVCGDGIVKFMNPTGRNTWALPNWQALVNDPTYYCLPIPFSPLPNLAINCFLGLFGTSVPQSFVNVFNIRSFELRFKENAVITVTDTTAEDQSAFVTGTCPKTVTVTNTITCCPDFSAKQNATKTIGSHDYRMKKKFKIHYRERHGDQNIGSCWDLYASFFVSEKTHLRAKTVLQVRKKAKVGSVTLFSYWFRTGASEIAAGVSGNFMSKDPTTGCNCGNIETWNNGKTNHNRGQVVYRENTPSLYKTNKTIEVKSFHRVVKNGVTWDSSTDGTAAEIVKPIGACSP